MLELNRVYNMDCMEGMAQIPDKYFELAIVDPPYGVGNFNQDPHPSKQHNRKWDVVWNDSPPQAQYFEEVFRVSVNQIIWGINYYWDCVPTGGVIFWDKGNNSDVGSQGEIAYCSLQTKVTRYYEKWTGFINSERGKGRIHPCQKPVALYKWLLANYAKPGDKILDTHVGSGSSIIACIDMGFEYMGFEIDADYYKAMQDRIYHFTRQEALPL